MRDIFDSDIDIKANYSDRFADYLNRYERFCPLIDKNVLLSLNLPEHKKTCSNYANCEKKELCKLIKH